MVKKLKALLLVFLVWTGSTLLQAQSGIFDRTGVIPGHGSYSSLPEERVDLFSGNLTLSYRDIFLPGPNGLNIEIWRVYNSKILQDRRTSQNPTVQAYPKSMVGIGWSMHMGLIHNFLSGNPIIEFPDGRREMAFYPKSEYEPGVTTYYTRDFLKYEWIPGDQLGVLTLKNGTVWMFGESAFLPLVDGSSELVLLLTAIVDPLGNSINVQYDPDDDNRSIKKISDSLGREIRFAKSYQGSEPAKLAEIRIKNYDETHDVVYSYSVDTFANGYYRLASFTPPGLPATTYEYNNGLSTNYELIKVTSSYGGMLEYSYQNHNFYFSSILLDSKVVSQKRITYDTGEQAKVWNYTYPTYQGASTGTTTVQGPEYSITATHYGYESSSSNRWRIGLETAQGTSDGSYSATNVWTNYEFSDTSWLVFGINMGKAKGPLVSSIIESRTGDSSLRRVLDYRTGLKKFGLPTKVSYFVNGSPSAKGFNELAYFFETHTSFKDRYMLSFIENEKDKTGTGIVLRETITSYHEETGKWGALKRISRWKDGTNYYTWDYAYTSNVPTSYTIGVDAPGEGGVTNILYQYGIAKEASAPDFLKYTRSIAKYGYILSEKNQYGGSRTYIYDDLGRTTAIELRNAWESGDPPAPFLTVGYNWRPGGQNQVVITQGGNTITRCWDGMGRDTGFTEYGDGTTLYYLRTLDAEGRVKYENNGSIGAADKYSYLYDAAGRILQVTDPMNEITAISYTSTTRTLTDPENHSTVYMYNDLPGLPTRLTDAQSHIADYAYDAVGRLKTVTYQGSMGRIQTYEYDGLDHIAYEIHPETGRIDYAYDAGNRLMQKSWGGIGQVYIYNASGQLTGFTGAETITYSYNEKGAVNSIVGSTGWSRSAIEYNDFGAVTHETILIPGLASKSVSYGYDYDGYGNPKMTTTYPDGKESVLGSNGLGQPESLTFNPGGGPTSIVDNASYGPNKMPAAVNLANGTTQSSTFYSNGTPNTVSLTKGSTLLYNATYSYDGAGNITGISSTAPAPALSATFAYDSLNRLTSATYSTGDPGKPGTYGYEYDAYGNMLTVRHNGGIAFSGTYDAQNRIRNSGYQYDARGNLTLADGRNFVWDSQNRLCAVTDISGQFMAEYAYDDRGLRIATLAPKPDIEITGYPQGSNADFVSALQSPSTMTFTVFNSGYGNLNLSTIAPPNGQDGGMFSVYQQPSPLVPPGQSTQFVIRFLPTSIGDKTASLTITSDDPDENPYVIALRGYCIPDINIGGVQGGTYDFGTVIIGESSREVFEIQNAGTATLLLYGAPVLEQSGGGYDFYLEEEGAPVPSSIAAGGNALFAIRFAPTGEGSRMATLTIQSSDPDENPRIITFVGTGLNGSQKIVDGSELTLLAPIGGESLHVGSFRDIRWTGGQDVECVKIEYSTDNGSAFRTIADRVANIGAFPWKVPDEASDSCLVRISDADGAPAIPIVVSFEFNFRVSSVPEESIEDCQHFVFQAGVPDTKTGSFRVAEVAFAPDGVRATENLLFNYAMGEIQGSEKFLGLWHQARITYDMTNYTGSVWIDNRPVLTSVPLREDMDVQASPEISISRGVSVPVELWIDDLEVGFLDMSLNGRDTADVAFRPLFRDNFNKYEIARFPRQGGWLPGPLEIPDGENGRREAGEEGAEMLRAVGSEEGAATSGIDDRIYASSAKSFKLEASEEEPRTVVKRFSLPERIPYAVSAETFAIVDAGDTVMAESGGILVREREETSKRQKRWDGITADSKHHSTEMRETGISRPKRTTVRREAGEDKDGAKLMSGSPVTGVFYIYAFDGRLLAEYDVSGLLVRDYLYFGGKLVAEYRNQGSQLLYYASDQINSTRVVTDSTGTVVYAAAHEAYGGIQKTWISTYDPSLRFSGEQGDTESGLDYFGARYYDPAQYRFLGVDPGIFRDNAVANPQRWNLYAYCLNNPVRYLDPDGADAIHFTIRRDFIQDNMMFGVMYSDDHKFWSTTMEPLFTDGKKGSAIPDGEYNAKPLWYLGHFALELSGEGIQGRRVAIHFGEIRQFSVGCILIGMQYNQTEQRLIGSALRLAQLQTYIIGQMINLGSESMNQRFFLDSIMLSCLSLDYMSWMLDLHEWAIGIGVSVVGGDTLLRQSI